MNLSKITILAAAALMTLLMLAGVRAGFHGAPMSVASSTASNTHHAA